MTHGKSGDQLYGSDNQIFKVTVWFFNLNSLIFIIKNFSRSLMMFWKNLRTFYLINQNYLLLKHAEAHVSLKKI
jgi:hypothetical protein